MSEKLYRVKMNSKGMPNFSTAVEVSEDYVSKEWVKENMLKYGFLAPDMTVAEFVADAFKKKEVTNND